MWLIDLLQPANVAHWPHISVPLLSLFPYSLLLHGCISSGYGTHPCNYLNLNGDEVNGAG